MRRSCVPLGQSQSCTSRTYQHGRVLQVALADAATDVPRIVQLFDDGGPWIARLADTLAGIQQAVAARDRLN
jgi:hypothetical protein